MNREEYIAAVNAVQIAAGIIEQVDLIAALETIEHADALGPILDPTLYKNASAKMDQVRNLLMAARPLQAELRRQIAASRAVR